MTSWATLAAAAMPMSSVISRLATTNDGGSTTSPDEAKIIVGGPHTRHGCGGNAASINTDVCYNTCVSELDGAAASRFLERSLGGLILAPRSHTAAFDHCW